MSNFGTYKMDFKELANLYIVISLNARNQLKIIEMLQQASSILQKSDNFNSETADSIKYYYASVYSKLASALTSIVLAHTEEILNYLQMFETHDLGADTRIDSYTLQKIHDKLEENANKLAEEYRKVHKIRNSVSDILPIDSRRKKDPEEIYDMMQYIEKIDADIYDIDAYLMNSLGNLDGLIIKTSDLIHERTIKNRKLTNFTDIWQTGVGQDFEKYLSRYQDRDPRALMKSIVDNFEKERPDVAKEFDAFLATNDEPISAEDKRAIKYYAYTASEPYRSMFLMNLKNFRFSDKNIDENDIEHYRRKDDKFKTTDDGKIYIKSPKLLDKDGIETLFHECGHALDDQSNTYLKNGYDTEAMRIKIGKKSYSLNQAMDYDIFDNPNVVNLRTMVGNAHSFTHSSGDVDNVINAYRNNTYDSLNDDDKQLYNTTRNAFIRNFPIHENAYSSVTDAYGGATKNAIRRTETGDIVGWGHDDDYWNTGGKKDREFFADYFSQNMMGDASAVATTKTYFPTATNIIDEYAKEYCGNYPETHGIPKG